MIRAVLILMFTALFLAACATAPEMNDDLAAAEQRLDTIENSNDIQRYAASEVDNARTAVERAAASWREDGNSPAFRHHLYVAQRSLDIAEATAAVERMDDQAERLSRERDRLRLEARASRAEVAEMAARARAVESAAQAEAATAAAIQERMQRERAQAQREQAMTERERAEQERQLAEQQRREAEMQAQAAMQEAEQARQELADLRSQFAELQAEQTERGLLLTLRDVLFDFNEANLKSGAERQMAELASYLAAYPDRPIRIEGFTDSVGSDEYNQGLSERRAQSVQAALVANGVDSARITTRGYGEAFPVAGNNSDTGRAQNRRVEIIISYDDQPVQARD